MKQSFGSCFISLRSFLRMLVPGRGRRVSYLYPRTRQVYVLSCMETTVPPHDIIRFVYVKLVSAPACGVGAVALVDHTVVLSQTIAVYH